MTGSSETIARTTQFDATVASAADLGATMGTPEPVHVHDDLHHRYWQLEVALVRVRLQSTALSRAIAGLSP